MHFQDGMRETGKRGSISNERCFRIALAEHPFPATPEESVTLAERAIAQASLEGAGIICFPECFVPGYRVGKAVPPANPRFLERAWSDVRSGRGESRSSARHSRH